MPNRLETVAHHAAVVAARDAQAAAARDLEAVLTPDQRPALAALLATVEERHRIGYWHLADLLAELLPGVGPAIRFIAEETERRVDLARPTAA
jgi:hypothetical protein